MVVMSMKIYEQSVARTELFNRIAEGEEDVRKGRLRDSDSVLKSIRDKFFKTEV